MSELPERRADTLARVVEERLAVPVLIAAVVSVPAVFLALTGGVAAVVGNALNTASGVVLIGESLVLLVLCERRRAWVRTHRSKIALAAATGPAVVLLVGPVQVLRLVIFLSAAREQRIRRILGAAGVITRRTNLPDHHNRLVLWVVGCVAVVFAAVVLADPHSVSHQAAGWVVEHLGLWPTVIAGLLVAGVVATVSAYRRRVRGRAGSGHGS
jgi:hypothetical protein